MTLAFLAKTVHMLSWCVLVLASVQKNRLISGAPMVQDVVQRLRFWDKSSAAASGLMVLSGFGLLMWAKPSAYYIDSPWFTVKMVFLLVGSVWIVYTRRWMRRTLSVAQWPARAPEGVRRGLRFDLICVSVMTACGLALTHGWSL